MMSNPIALVPWLSELRRWRDSKTKSGLVRQTTPAVMPSAFSRAAEAMTSGIIAPTPTRVTLSSTGSWSLSRYPPATACLRRRSSSTASVGMAARAWSSGRVVSRK
ncbi:hypothetical protein D9M72_400810 [compost metagenome]